MDIQRFSQEIPMYLLEEDEGNDEEIRQIMRETQLRTEKKQQNNQECQSPVCEDSPSSDIGCCRNDSTTSFSPSLSTVNSPSHSPSLTPPVATPDDINTPPTSVSSSTLDTTVATVHNLTAVEETDSSISSLHTKSHPTTLPIQSPASSSVTHPSINSLLSSPSSSSPSPTASDCSSVSDFRQNGSGGSGGGSGMVMFPLVNWTRMTAIPINILPPDNNEKQTQHQKLPMVKLLLCVVLGSIVMFIIACPTKETWRRMA